MLNPFRYRSYYFDAETGLYYLNTRYYDPEIGRFINADVIEILDITQNYINGINLYAYAQNNPVMYDDPTGLLWRRIGRWVAAAAIVVAVTAEITRRME